MLKVQSLTDFQYNYRNLYRLKVKEKIRSQIDIESKKNMLMVG